jgi:uncharacterized protein DUF1259
MRSANRVVAVVVAIASLLALTATSAPAQPRKKGEHRAHPNATGPSAGAPTSPATSKSSEATPLPVKTMESILQAKGSVSNEVLSVGIDRSDIPNVQVHGVPIKPSFEINGDLTFQPVGANSAFFNGDIPVKPSEINPVIDAIINNGLTFQAEHQHLYDFEPMVWFIHMRGRGNPLRLASAVHSVLKATSTPLPQEPPSHPTTPLDKSRLKRILHGYEAQVGEDGVVTVFVARRNPIKIDGVVVKPETNIATNVAFEPLNSQGTEAAAVPDFAMEASEINPVMTVMRNQGWDIGCLYNQETDEHPQLYFSHQLKTGDPYQLAEEIRKGLNQTNAQ